MYYRKALCAQQENVDQGTLQITVHSKTDNRPVENALVRISYTGDPNSIIEEVRTDSSGNTPVLQLKTPPLEYSLNASEEAQPYAEYSMQIKAEDFHLEEIAGTEVLPAVLAKQPVLLNPRQSTVSENRIVIPPHTLFYEYPPKIQESEIKPVHETGGCGWIGGVEHGICPRRGVRVCSGSGGNGASVADREPDAGKCRFDVVPEEYGDLGT